MVEQFGTTPTLADVAAANYRAKELERQIAELRAERDDLALRAATIDEALTNAIHLRRAAEAKLAKVEAEVEMLRQQLAGEIQDGLVHAHRADRLSAELAEARKERGGLALIVNARKKHVDAVAAYNARREVLKTVPLGCRNLDIEFRAFSDAQSDFIATAQTVADSFLASKDSSR